MKRAVSVLLALLLTILSFGSVTALAAEPIISDYGCINAAGEKITSPEGVEVIRGFAEITNNDYVAGDLGVLLLAYYENDMLKTVKMKELSVDAETSSARFTTDPIYITVGAENPRFNVFVFEDMDSLMPQKDTVAVEPEYEGAEEVVDYADISGIIEADGGYTVELFPENYAAFRTITVEANADVYLNGAECTDDLLTVFDNIGWNSAKCTLTFRNEVATANTYNEVYIDHYVNFVVGSVDTDEMIVFAKRYAGYWEELWFGSEDMTVTLINANGVPMDWTNLQENDVLTLQETENGDGTYTIKAQLTRRSVSGTVTGRDDYGNCKIGDIWYHVDTSCVPIPQLEKTGIFYFDCFGNIACFEDTTEKNYAYIIAVDESAGSFEASIDLKLFTDSGEVITVRSTEKIKLDGAATSVQSQGALDGWVTDDPIAAGQFITYKMNTEGKVTAIARPDYVGTILSYHDDADLAQYNDTATDVTYRASGSRLFGLGSVKINADTKIMVAPADADDDGDYGLLSSADIPDGQALGGIYAYDVDSDTKEAAAVLVTVDPGLALVQPEAVPVVKPVDTAEHYGYVIAVDEANAQMKVFNDKEEMVVTSLPDGAAAGQLIIYQLNAEGTLSFFEVLSATTEEATDCTYSGGELAELGIKIDENTAIMVAPSKSGDDEDYVIAELSALRDGQELGGVYAYDVDSATGIAKIILVTRAIEALFIEDGIAVLKKITEELDEEGNRIACFTVLQGGEEKVLVGVDDDTFGLASFNGAFFPMYNGKGNIVGAVPLVYEFDGYTDPALCEDYLTAYKSYCWEYDENTRIYFGYPVEKIGSELGITATAAANGDEGLYGDTYIYLGASSITIADGLRSEENRINAAKVSDIKVSNSGSSLVYGVKNGTADKIQTMKVLALEYKGEIIDTVVYIVAK